MTYVEGIGDEVLLFFTFVIASFGILLFLFLREVFRRNNVSDRRSETVDAQASLDDNSNLHVDGTPATSYSDFQQRTPVPGNSPTYFSATREENVNDTENFTEATRNNDQQLITVRLILQELTINAQVFHSTTLRDLKK